MEKKTRGRPKQELNDDVKRNLQLRQHNYYVNYKNKKNQPPPIQESTTTLQESLNNIVKIIDNIKAAFIK
jgi:hypothetical protein